MESHLENRKQKRVDEDIEKNMSPDVVILSNHGNYMGKEGVKESSKVLQNLLGKGEYTYKEVQVEKDFAFLEWSGESKDKIIEDGADSFYIKDGKIVFQSVHYTVKPK